MNNEANSIIKNNKSYKNRDDISGGEIRSFFNNIEQKILDSTTIRFTDGKLQYILPKIFNKQNETLSALNAVVENLNQLVSKQQETITEQSKIIENQHNSISRYENDVLFRSKKELIMELIGIADQIKYTIDDQVTNKDYDRLIDEVRSLGDWVDGSLQTETVRRFEHTRNDNILLDAKCQEVIGTEETNVIEEHNHLKTMLPGYYWTMPLVGSSMMMKGGLEPRQFEFVLRPEKVVKLVYTPKESSRINYEQPISKTETLPGNSITVEQISDKDYFSEKKTTESHSSEDETSHILFTKEVSNDSVEQLSENKLSVNSMEENVKDSLGVYDSCKPIEKEKFSGNNSKKGDNYPPKIERTNGKGNIRD